MHINSAIAATILAFCAGASAWSEEDSHFLSSRDANLYAQGYNHDHGLFGRDAISEGNVEHLFERDTNYGIFSREAKPDLDSDYDLFYPRGLGYFDTESGDTLIRRKNPAKAGGGGGGSASPKAPSTPKSDGGSKAASAGGDKPAKAEKSSSKSEAGFPKAAKSDMGGGKAAKSGLGFKEPPSTPSKSSRHRSSSSLRSVMRSGTGFGVGRNGGFGQRFNTNLQNIRYGAGGLENSRSFAASNARYNREQRASGYKVNDGASSKRKSSKGLDSSGQVSGGKRGNDAGLSAGVKSNSASAYGAGPKLSN